MDKIELTGNISRINDKDEKFTWFDICRNEKYKNKNGEMQEIASFFDIKVDKEKIKTDLFKKGAFVKVIGIPNSYIDRNNIKHFYVFAVEIKNPSLKEETSDKTSLYGYDDDGVMLWDGKRCESTPATEEEIKEMEAMLSEFE